MNAPIRYDASLLTGHDIYLFKEGCHFRLYEKLGAHPHVHEDIPGTLFSVWAPNAHNVYVIGDFNRWDPTSHPLARRKDASGIWEGFIPDVGVGAMYKYRIHGAAGYVADRSDPFARRVEMAAGGASIIWQSTYDWSDANWVTQRGRFNSQHAPWSVYELHLGSWRRVPEEGNRPLKYQECARYLSEHVHHMGYTHIHLLSDDHPKGTMETAPEPRLFAPDPRYGLPDELMLFIDQLHQQGIGVIMDLSAGSGDFVAPDLQWFDGAPLFELPESTPGHPLSAGNSRYNYARPEVRAVLISRALFWLEHYHLDALCVPHVGLVVHSNHPERLAAHVLSAPAASADTAAIQYLRNLNDAAYREVPDVQMLAGECGTCAMVSRPTYVGGLGFGMAWNMGWMQDMLRYFARDPITRKYHQEELTFSASQTPAENFVLPLPHHEARPATGSLLARLPGRPQHKFATLRLLFGYMYGHPGKKLTFMGNEFGTWTPWRNNESLAWHELQTADHLGVMKWVRDLNHLYREEACLHELDFSAEGFEWIDTRDAESSVISFLRKAKNALDVVLVVCNATPVTRRSYRLGVPHGGQWRELLNSDALIYGGSGVGNFGLVQAAPVGAHGRYHSLVLDLAPLSALYFKPSSEF